MTRSLLLLLLLAGPGCCTTHEATKAPTLATPFVERDGYIFAVVELVAGCAEASGLGGTHWWFRVDGSNLRLHAGGHGVFASLPLSYTGETLADVPVDRRYFVAQVTVGATRASGDRGPWCNDGSDDGGGVVALGRARGLADARARLAEVARTGVLTDTVGFGSRPPVPFRLDP